MFHDTLSMVIDVRVVCLLLIVGSISTLYGKRADVVSPVSVAVIQED
jgi:hypothetical protein